MNYKVNQRERVYFYLKVLFSIIIIFGLFVSLRGFSGNQQGIILISTIVVYGLFIWLFFFFQKVLLIGHIKGNGIEISETQFSEIYIKYKNISDALNIKKTPKLFVIQNGGLLNAFAARFSGKNYIAIYSDIFSVFEKDESVIMFVLAHELGHVKRMHLIKNFWTFPSIIVPFLEAAYSRGCEYTCDNIGNAYSLDGSIKGMTLLAAGKDIYEKVNVEKYVESGIKNYSGVVKFAGLFMTHPYLTKRIQNIRKQ